METDHVDLAGSWRDGPGLAKRPDGHALPGLDCGSIPLHLWRAVGDSAPETWELAYVGADIQSGLDCSCVNAASLYEGSLIQAPSRNLSYVIKGQRVEFEREATALNLCRSRYQLGVVLFDSIPYAATVHVGDPVWQAPSRPGAFLLDDDRLWPVSCSEIVTDNSSALSSVSLDTWLSHAIGPSLFCTK